MTALLFAWALAADPPKADAPKPEAPAERRVALEATCTPPAGAAKLPVPLDDDWQRVTALEAPSGWALERDRVTGTRWLAGLATGAAIRYRVELALRPRVVGVGTVARQKLPAKSLAPWLAPGDPALSAEGLRIAGKEGEPRARAEKLFAVARTKPVATVNAAFVDLCRGSGIPARLEAGLRLPPDGSKVVIADQWTCFHDPARGWTPVEVPLADGFGKLGGLPVCLTRGAAPAATAVQWSIGAEGK